MNPLRVGVCGYCPPTKFDESEALRMVRAAYDSVVKEYPERTIQIVSGLTNVGVLALAYAEAARRGWHTVGITSSRALEHPLYPCDEQLIVGTEWGAESPTFVATIDLLIRVGGGKQSHSEVKLVRTSGRPVIEYDLPAL